jgi:hypothetical protein
MVGSGVRAETSVRAKDSQGQQMSGPIGGENHTCVHACARARFVSGCEEGAVSEWALARLHRCCCCSLVQHVQARVTAG